MQANQVTVTVMKKLCVILLLCCSVSIGKAQGDSVIGRAKLYEPSMLKAAEKYRVDPRLLWTIGYLETSFRPGLTSRAGARGLMRRLLALAQTLEHIGNKNAVSDARVASMLAKTAIDGATENVNANLAGMSKQARAKHSGI